MPSELAREIAKLRGWSEFWTDADTDPAACMELLQHVTELPQVWQVMTEHLHRLHYVRIDGYQRSFKASASNDSFFVAIATACRDALKAISEMPEQ